MGVTNFQKKLAEPINKLVKEGDLAGMIMSIIEIKTQYMDINQIFDKPLTEFFKPVSQAFEIFAGSATKTIVASESFQKMLRQLSEPETIDKIVSLGEEMGNLLSELMDVDIDKIIDFLDSLVSAMQTLNDMKNGSFWTQGLNAWIGTGENAPDMPTDPNGNFFTLPQSTGGAGVKSVGGGSNMNLTINSGFSSKSVVEACLSRTLKFAALWGDLP